MVKETVMNTVFDKLPVTVLIAAKNEEPNIGKCMRALQPAEKVILLDSGSQDNTAAIAAAYGAEVVQFHYAGGYPKKRQWALERLSFTTEWVFFVDADEVVPEELWEEIRFVLKDPHVPDAFLITKGFHFLGKKFRYGGFSHKAVLLLRIGRGQFEHILDDPADFQDIEVHERLIVNGQIGILHTPLIHEDFKSLSAYIDRHNKYATWEAAVRYHYLQAGSYGSCTITPRLFGNVQERRRFFKKIIMRIPFEPMLWFLYHYILRLGFLEGRRGRIAAQIRSQYIANVRIKIYEQKLKDQPAFTQTPIPA